MNILFFLTPKRDVTFIYDNETLRQALEKLEYHRFSAIPIIDHENGEYIGTITEGDLLWYIKDRYELNMKDAEEVPILAVKRMKDNEPVDADANIEDLISKVVNQNYVPVLDDVGCFIGIITRKDVILYLKNKCGVPDAEMLVEEEILIGI